MKVLIINSVCGTGRICLELARMVSKQGGEAVIAYGRGSGIPDETGVQTHRIGTNLDVCLHGLKTRLTDAHGFGSRRATKKFIRWMRQYDPDVIHLHNLHGYYLHIGLLFRALAEMKKPIIWTLHDFWPLTGHCAHYDGGDCGKWKTGCGNCPRKRAYPASWLLDRSRKNYREKKRLFSMPERMTLVTPSAWFAGEVGRSFLGQYPILAIHNGIDTNVCYPENGKNCGKVVLGVANIWDEHKGLDTMMRLRSLLGEEWQMVLVGLSEKQIARLPRGITGICRTKKAEELAAWYRAADVYVNASTGEAMGMTTAEAISCGTPVASFDAGAAAEIVGANGIVAPYGDVDALADAVREIDTRGRKPYRVDCGRFTAEKQYEQYWKLYQQLGEK